MKIKYTLPLVFLSIICIYSCESPEEKKKRLENEEHERIELAEQRKAEEEEKARQREIERQNQIIYNKYINNSLRTGATPYSYLYGKNRSCDSWGCSEIKVQSPYNSDVLVTIKKAGNVLKHAYIKAGNSYTFQMPNGNYQTFFYYGKGWNPNKIMKKTSAGVVKGGFVDNETFGKDYPQSLSNSILTYELILQANGNFSTKPSNASEAF